jgi:hypothetical protein
MRPIALGLLALTFLVAASSDCLARGGGHGHGHGHGHSSGSTAHHQHLAFPARSRSRAEVGPSAVSCAEMVFNVGAAASICGPSKSSPLRLGRPA